jgi:hypothetical protein
MRQAQGVISMALSAGAAPAALGDTCPVGLSLPRVAACRAPHASPPHVTTRRLRRARLGTMVSRGQVVPVDLFHKHAELMLRDRTRVDPFLSQARP